MKVKELIKALSSMDPEKEVYIPCEHDLHDYFNAGTAREKTLVIGYNKDKDDHDTEEAVVIDFE